MIEFAGRGILLDIEGTTSSISFVHDVMFPYVREQLDSFLEQHFARDDVVQACESIARDAGFQSLQDWLDALPNRIDPRHVIRAEVVRLMDGDVKATGLKALQGLIWDNGFRSGQLRAHVYPDVLPAIEQWRAADIDVRIFSSGSIAAQKLFFGHLDIAINPIAADPIVADRSVGRSASTVADRSVGPSAHNAPNNYLHLFSSHYDTTIGSKKEASSYAKIAADWQLNPRDILFISDLAAELDAASAAGMQVVASLRPGNAALPEPFSHRMLSSFDQLQISRSLSAGKDQQTVGWQN